MDPLTLVVGVAAVAYGLYTTYARVKSPSSFGKLAAMRSRFGHAAGTAVHVIAYTVLPVVFGLVAIVLGMQGKSIF
ncbi:MAG TPA: hypothetical protein VF406_21265 [Thermodesulfobacteriota bacterium]